MDPFDPQLDRETYLEHARRQADDVEIRTVSFVSLGCPKNLVDSEKMLGLLAQAGVSPVSACEGANREDLSVAGSEQDADTPPAIDPADAVVINTCGFLEASKQESLATIRAAVAAKERGEIKRVVVAGCLVQRHRAKLFDWAPGIDAMLGVYDRERVLEAVRGARPDRTGTDDAGEHAPYWISPNALRAAEQRGRKTVGLTIDGKRGDGIGYYESDAARLRLTPRHYAYLRISEGCNQSCAFCTIPAIRGKMRSKPAGAVIEEARELIRDGAHELLLIGQDTTSYGDDIRASKAGRDASLPTLLRSLSRAMENENSAGWLRLMYAYPTTFGDDMIDVFAELAERGRLLPYLDIPLQHASNRVLDLMRRNVTREQQLELCHKLRARVPGMAIRTTFISGFPGETEDDHDELLEFIDEVGFDAVGVFRFSPEDHTHSARLLEDPAMAVPQEVAERRRGEILELQQRIAFEQNAYVVDRFDPAEPTDSGVVLDILVDEPAGEDPVRDLRVYRGRSYAQAPGIDSVTLIESRETLSPGELVRCTITGWDGYDLVATPCEELAPGLSLKVLR